MIDLADLKACVKLKKIAITEHARKRLVQRKISVDDIIQCISDGKIIEQYEDDRPFPSCLILGNAENGETLHCVMGFDGDCLYLITAYYPSDNIWEGNYAKRKKE